MLNFRFTTAKRSNLKRIFDRGPNLADLHHRGRPQRWPQACSRARCYCWKLSHRGVINLAATQ
jgi:hypothetical protein